MYIMLGKEVCGCWRLIKVRKGMLTVVVLAVIVIACSLNGMSGEGEAIGAIKHI